MNQDNTNPIKQQVYYIRTGKFYEYSSDFKRIVWFFTKSNSEDRIYLIYYKGDHTKFHEVVHGNRKINLERKYTATDKSLLSKIRDTSKTPLNLYRSMLQDESEKLYEKGENFDKIYEKSHLPKSSDQIKDRLKYSRQKERISKDEIYSLYQIVLNIPEFILKFEILPEKLIICGKFKNQIKYENI